MSLKTCHLCDEIQQVDPFGVCDDCRNPQRPELPAPAMGAEEIRHRLTARIQSLVKELDAAKDELLELRGQLEVAEAARDNLSLEAKLAAELLSRWEKWAEYAQREYRTETGKELQAAQ